MFPAAAVYFITDVSITRLSHAEQVSRLISGGARLIQLREKQLSPREFFSQAEQAIKVARPHGVRIIINDRVDIALALKADGVHLGQDDMPPQAARALLGSEALIGFSTHNLNQARKARSLAVDYLAVGPIFVTSSKANPDPVVGLEGLRLIREGVGDFPLVAIGGITSENIENTLEAGANCAAVLSSALANPTGITAATADLIAHAIDSNH
ncbi:MAG TPA: thiamine phosphate synthase [Pyrinomonadaceae bacterium]|nr:thiamine phosphate synthase [Pyrinomonadaceae bacterium]